MTNSPVSTSSHLEQDTQTWDSLKGAIASSSGFQRWQIEHPVNEYEQNSLDYRVRHYLRETLETLAY